MDPPFSYATVASRGSTQSNKLPTRVDSPAQPLKAAVRPPTQTEKTKLSLDDNSEENKENVKEQSLLERKDSSFEENSERYQLEKQNAARFGLCEDTIIFMTIAKYLDPKNAIDFGRSCKFLVKQIFSDKVWKQVSDPTVKPIITIRLDSSKQLDGYDLNKEKQDHAPLNGNNIQTLPVEDYNNELRRKRLANYWMALTSDAQEERDSKSTKKKDVDPLMVAARPPPLQVKLGGGISIEALNNGKKGRRAGDRPTTKVLMTNDLSVIPVWLNGIIELLRGKTKVTLPYINGTVTLVRIDRGGSVVKFVLDEKDPSETKTFYFSLPKFCIALRDAAKEYRKLVANCLQIIIDRRKDVNIPPKKSEEDDSEQKLIQQRVMEKESVIRQITAKNLDEGVKTIKNLLRSGAVSGTSLAVYFKNRKEHKQRVNAQRALEYNNMYKFLLKNLPADYEEVVANAATLSTDAEKRRQAQKVRSQLRREQFDAQRQQQQLQQQQNKANRPPPPPRENITKIVGKNLKAAQEKAEEDLKELLKDPVKKLEYEKKQQEEAKKRREEREEAEKKKAENRVRKVAQKTVDEDGFILEQTKFVKGSNLPEPPVVPEPEPEVKGKKQNKKQQKQQGKKAQKGKAKNQPEPELIHVPEPEEDESYLASNPYATIMNEEDTDYETLNEALYKRVMRKQEEASPAKSPIQKGKQAVTKGKPSQKKGQTQSKGQLAKAKTVPQPKNKQVQKKGKWANKQTQQRDARKPNALTFWEANPLVFQAVLGFLLLVFLSFVYSFVISGIST